jgi:streptogramin lyase
VRACAVSVDSQDRVYCFNRNAEHPVVIFDRDGNFLSSWGAGMFTFPHAIRIDESDSVWLCDEHHGQFMKFTTDGRQTISARRRGRKSRMAAGLSTCRPTSRLRPAARCS